MFKGLRPTTKQVLSIVLVLIMLISMSVHLIPSQKVSAASDVIVNPSEMYQEIKGFGGINHPEWIGDLTESQRETAFGNGANQLGFSVLRVYINDDRNQWYRAVPTAKAAIEKGAIVFASPWNPPNSMIETFTRNGVPNQKRLRHDKYADYAQHLNDFVAFMKQNGVDLYAISVQNEPDYAMDWTWWTPEEILTFMRDYAGSINCRVMAPESFQYLKNISDPILNDPKALANMDILGAHFYGTTVNNMAYPLFKQKGAGKELWMTEVYVPNSDNNSADRWPEAVDVAYNMHNALMNDFQTYVWWYIRRSYGPIKEDGSISKRGYCMAQYSKFVRPGAYRISATSNPDSNIHVSAYKNIDGETVLVAINRGSSEVSQNFKITGESIASVERYRTSATENLAKSNIQVNGDGFSAQLPSQSVSTFVVSSSSTPVEPDKNGYYFHSTFEDGLDGWDGRGSATVLISGRVPYLGTEALLVQERASAWNGATKEISSRPFAPGEEFSFSVCANYLEGDPTTTFYLKLQYQDSLGETRYSEIAAATAIKGQYVQLANTNYKIPNDASDMKLYVETAEGTMNFYIDEAIGAVAGTVIDGPKEVNFIIGDVNYDGVINALDLSLAKRNLFGGNYELTADVNQNGVVDEDDIAQIKAFLLGSITKFTLKPKEVIPEPEVPEPEDFDYAQYVAMVTNSLVNAEPSSATAERPGVRYGTIEKTTYYSDTCKRVRNANVLLPAGYDPSKKYPVLYALHGYWGDENSLLDAGDPGLRFRQIIGNAIADGEAEEMIVVFPYIFASDTRDTLTGMNDESNAAYDNFINDLINDLMPHMAKTYSIAEGRKNTAVTGFSMGGRESLFIVHSRPDLFGYVGAMCPAPGVSPGLIAENDFNFAKSSTAPYLVMITAGSNDTVVYSSPDSYHKILERNNSPHVWHYVHGGAHAGNSMRPHMYTFVRSIFKH
ncbi:MAG: hypothetical protein GX365_02135 [Clostridiales bacterium]|nr:hypothetical protein [Clostridiales bacterium]